MVILIESYRSSQCTGVVLERCYYLQGGWEAWQLEAPSKHKTRDVIPLFYETKSP